MSLAAPSDKTAEINKRQKALPRGYQRLGTATVVAKEASKVCLEVGSATVEVTALAPDLFRVGFFPDDQPVDYSSLPVVAREGPPGLVAIADEAGGGTVPTAALHAHLLLAPFLRHFPHAPVL